MGLREKGRSGAQNVNFAPFSRTRKAKFPENGKRGGKRGRPFFGKVLILIKNGGGGGVFFLHSAPPFVEKSVNFIFFSKNMSKKFDKGYDYKI